VEVGGVEEDDPRLLGTGLAARHNCERQRENGRENRGVDGRGSEERAKRAHGELRR
jgi:hypothetical protein